MSALDVLKVAADLVRSLRNPRVSPTSAIDWNERETAAYECLRPIAPLMTGEALYRKDVFLGGDSLRPYLSVRLGSAVAFASKLSHGSLSLPELLLRAQGGQFPRAIRTELTSEGAIYGVWYIPDQGPSTLFPLPEVYLATLTDVSRYRTRRYPLNVARLAQWLRFQHAARARATDLALDFRGEVDHLVEDIIRSRPDVLGVSLNFGELKSLRRLVSALRRSELRPVLCLGNVLATWARADVLEMCSDFPCLISASYGEGDLERVCRTLSPLLGPSQSVAAAACGSSSGHSRRGPSAIVLPDERLLLDTLREGGQPAIETSFGCQYGHCTFCPRDHRGEGWRRPLAADAVAVVGGMASLISRAGSTGVGVLSIVDEDAFGEEGRAPGKEPFVTQLVATAAAEGVSCEIYTRAEQVLDLDWAKQPSVDRLGQLKAMRGALTRVFVGVESGSDSQLRRYGKGQTQRTVIAALRAGSLLGLPLEFGFITFDPLLTREELAENLLFLGRRDVVLDANAALDLNETYILATAEHVEARGEPVFSRVAYMATELELFANSPFLHLVRKAEPSLVGQYDATFARYSYAYRDTAIGEVASMCRVWTEGAFEPMYRMRLNDRSGGVGGSFRAVVGRYRLATYSLLVALAGSLCRDLRARAQPLWERECSGVPLHLDDAPGLAELRSLWDWVLVPCVDPGSIEPADFRLESRERRREA